MTRTTVQIQATPRGTAPLEIREMSIRRRFPIGYIIDNETCRKLGIPVPDQESCGIAVHAKDYLEAVKDSQDLVLWLLCSIQTLDKEDETHIVFVSDEVKAIDGPSTPQVRFPPRRRRVALTQGGIGFVDQWERIPDDMALSGR